MWLCQTDILLETQTHIGIAAYDALSSQFLLAVITHENVLGLVHHQSEAFHCYLPPDVCGGGKSIRCENLVGKGNF